jgi:hypothetical protein
LFDEILHYIVIETFRAVLPATGDNLVMTPHRDFH